jgi:EAL domain-containing protein (putative c-di-GMP-specific phosphodiesterase class I)
VVAEGVEDQATADLLRDLGCDEMQGYLIARPLEPAALETWLATRPAVRLLSG